MAGSMNWTGMEELIDTVEQKKQDWIRSAEELKKDAVNKLSEGYTGSAADTTSAKMDKIIKDATNYFDEVGRKLSTKLAEQKRAWEEQERKSQESVE